MESQEAKATLPGAEADLNEHKGCKMISLKWQDHQIYILISGHRF